MALSLANNYLEVVEIVVNDRNDRRNENVVKSEYESEHKEQEMEVDSGGGEQESERVQQSSEENNVPDVSEAHVTPWRWRSPEMYKFLERQQWIPQTIIKRSPNENNH